jgi:hypothetical protein
MDRDGVDTVASACEDRERWTACSSFLGEACRGKCRDGRRPAGMRKVSSAPMIDLGGEHDPM